MVYRNRCDVENRDVARHDANSELPCAHLTRYRSQAIAERELVRIQGMPDSRSKPRYVFECSAPCLGWHMGARTDEQKLAIAAEAYRKATAKPYDPQAPWTLSTSGWMDL